MSNSSDKVKQLIEEIKSISRVLWYRVSSAPPNWVWDTFAFAISLAQIAEIIEQLERVIRKVQKYCDEYYREFTNILLSMMWLGLQTKNYEAMLEAIKQLISIKINFDVQPFTLKLD